MGPAPAPAPVEHLHELPLLALAHALEVFPDLLEAAELRLERQEAAAVAVAAVVPGPPDQGADELAAQRLEVRLQRQQLPVVLEEDALVADRLLAHVAQQVPVALVLGDLAGAGPQDAGPQRGEQVGVRGLLQGRLARHHAPQVEELAVDGLEEREELQRVLQLGLDGLLEDAHELRERALQRRVRPLRLRHAEYVRHKGAEGRRQARRGVFEQARRAEEVVEVGVGCGEGWARQRLDLR